MKKVLRPRVNKAESRLDKDQKAESGNFYYKIDSNAKKSTRKRFNITRK